MKTKHVLAVTTAVVLLAAAAPAKAVSALSDSLYPRFSRSAGVKVCVADPVDAAIEPKADLKDLKERLEKAFAGRKSIRFIVQGAFEGAEIRIETRVTETLWLKDDPVDMIMGVGGVAMDAAVSEHYARMQAEFSVVDVKSGSTLWSRSLKATLTSNDVTPENYLKKINERMAEVFVISAFGKRRQG